MRCAATDENEVRAFMAFFGPIGGGGLFGLGGGAQPPQPQIIGIDANLLQISINTGIAQQAISLAQSLNPPEPPVSSSFDPAVSHHLMSHRRI